MSKNNYGKPGLKIIATLSFALAATTTNAFTFTNQTNEYVTFFVNKTVCSSTTEKGLLKPNSVTHFTVKELEDLCVDSLRNCTLVISPTSNCSNIIIGEATIDPDTGIQQVTSYPGNYTYELNYHTNAIIMSYYHSK
jgi:hypothetical protein